MTGRVYPTIGVDPGQRWIGLAARIDGRCLDACTLDRGPTRPNDRYLGEVEPAQATRLLDVIHTMMNRHQAAAEQAMADWQVPDGTFPWRVAMEGIVIAGAYQRRRYNVGERIAKLTTLVDVAAVVGMVAACFPGVVVVRPKKLGDPTAPGHGDVLARLGPYPKDLSGRRPNRFLGGDPCQDRRHEKAAWAAAGAAQLHRPLVLRPVQGVMVG